MELTLAYALTANAVPENRERAAVVGMDDFLVKPVNLAPFAEKFELTVS